MAIPRILHQTYSTNKLSGQLKDFREKLIDLHPGWEYRFYDDIKRREIIEEHASFFLPVYDSYTIPAQKADIFRIIVVYAIGGFYLDADIECMSSLDTLCEFRCVFAEELTITETKARELGHRDCLRVANYMFGSEPAHPFLLQILRKIAEESGREISSENDVLETTGPGLVTTVYHNTRDDFKDVVLLRNIDRISPKTEGVSCHFGNFAVHHAQGSWRWQNSQNHKLNEPAPRLIVPQSQIKSICREIDLKIDSSPKTEKLYTLRTFRESPYDGLSYVFDRTAILGILADDTSSLEGKKVLVSGIPAFFTGRISKLNTNVVYTTFESSSLPDFWVDAINDHYSYCVVPHPYVKKVFENSGVAIPLEVIHQGFTRYKRKDRKVISGDRFNIGFLGVPVERKNLFKLYQACTNLISDIPELRLNVHVPDYYEGMKTEFLGLVKMSPFVDWTEGHMSENEIGDWYGDLSCYIFPSSGEGWSFTPRESLYLGVPTILSDIPVHKELIDSGYCKVIPISGKTDAYFNGHISGAWDSVNVTDIEESIRELYLNYGSYYIKALQGSKWIEHKWTNESSQQRLLDFLLNL